MFNSIESDEVEMCLSFFCSSFINGIRLMILGYRNIHETQIKQNKHEPKRKIEKNTQNGLYAFVCIWLFLFTFINFWSRSK